MFQIDFYNNSNINFQQPQQQAQKQFTPNPNILPQIHSQVDLNQIENLIANGANTNELPINNTPKLPIQNANSLLTPLINNGLQAQLQNQWLNSYSSMMGLGQQNPLDLLNVFLPNALAQNPLNLLQQTASLQNTNGLFSQFPNLIGLNQFAAVNNQLQQQQTLIDNFKNVSYLIFDISDKGDLLMCCFFFLFLGKLEF